MFMCECIQLYSIYTPVKYYVGHQNTKVHVYTEYLYCHCERSAEHPYIYMYMSICVYRVIIHMYISRIPEYHYTQSTFTITSDLLSTHMWNTDMYSTVMG